MPDNGPTRIYIVFSPKERQEMGNPLGCHQHDSNVGYKNNSFCQGIPAPSRLWSDFFLAKLSHCLVRTAIGPR